MWKQDLLKLLSMWPDTRLITRIEVSFTGSILIYTTAHELYEYSHEVIRNLKEVN